LSTLCLFPVEEAYLSPSLLRLQILCFWFARTFLFVLAMTQVGTDEFDFLAFMSRFFLDASLFLPKLSKSS
jgi:hypothetical protein